MKPMDLKQFDKYMADLAQAPDKWGLGANRRIAAYLKKTHRKRLRGHKGAAGQPWAKTYIPPMPKVGDDANMLLDSGQTVRQTIRTRSGVRRAKAWRKKHGPPMRPLKAIVRTAGPKRFRATKVFDRLVTNVLTTKKTTARRKAAGLDTVTALSYSPRHLVYGYKAGTEWIEKLQFGGTFKDGKVPPREIVGLNNTDINFIADAYASAFVKFASRA